MFDRNGFLFNNADEINEKNETKYPIENTESSSIK